MTTMEPENGGRKGRIHMHEQTAILIQDYEEWLFIVDDDGPERVWRGVEAAIKELRLDGWEVAQGPAPIRSSFAELDEHSEWSYRLRRSIK
jgi:hypothetical protein